MLCRRVGMMSLAPQHPLNGEGDWEAHKLGLIHRVMEQLQTASVAFGAGYQCQDLFLPFQNERHPCFFVVPSILMGALLEKGIACCQQGSLIRC